jgi:hypothetical protein
VTDQIDARVLVDRARMGCHPPSAPAQSSVTVTKPSAADLRTTTLKQHVHLQEQLGPNAGDAGYLHVTYDYLRYGYLGYAVTAVAGPARLTP